MKAFKGTYSVLITPFTEDGEKVDGRALARLVRWQVEEGIHGLVPLGSTGEFLSVSREERAEIIETVVKAAAGRVPVLVGTGAEDTREAVALSREAEALGADGVMIIPPFYSSPTEEELVVHYRKIAEAISIPIMLYNNPATANIDLTPPLVARLSEIEGVRYIKESTLYVTRVRDILRLCGERMTVFGGILGYESFVEGAAGWIAVASNLMPRACSELFELVQRGEVAAARELNIRLLPIIEAVGGPRYVSATKAILAEMGLPVGRPRPPRLPLPKAEHEALRPALKALGLFGSLLEPSAAASDAGRR